MFRIKILLILKVNNGSLVKVINFYLLCIIGYFLNPKFRKRMTLENEK